MSGDDSPLDSVWDEICVQVQSEESAFWDAHLHTIRSVINGRVQTLPPFIKQALWLQTDPGVEWWLENEDAETCPHWEEDVVEYVLHEVLSCAADWTKERISPYLDGDYEIGE